MRIPQSSFRVRGFIHVQKLLGGKTTGVFVSEQNGFPYFCSTTLGQVIDGVKKPKEFVLVRWGNDIRIAEHNAFTQEESRGERPIQRLESIFSTLSLPQPLVWFRQPPWIGLCPSPCVLCGQQPAPRGSLVCTEQEARELLSAYLEQSMHLEVLC
jgi:hypothetical protein